MFPCSMSTNTQSTPVRASALDTFAPGNICQQPIAEPFFKATRSLLVVCIVDAILMFALCNVDTDPLRRDMRGLKNEQDK